MTSQEATGLLFKAIERGNQRNAMTAIDAGADPNAKNDLWLTPLHLAAEKGRTDTTRLLIEKGANLNARDFLQRTPLHWAAEYGQTDTTQLLIDKGAEVNANDKWQQTSLHLAAEKGRTDTTRLLIKKGADVNTRDERQQTPLHRATRTGQTELARLLIDKGADLNAEDFRRQTPLHLAAKNSDKETAVLLLRHGADLKATDNDGQSPRQGTPLTEWVSQLKQTTSQYLTLQKPTPAQCFSKTGNGALHDRVLDACVTGQFATLIGAPLVASTDKADRQLFQDIWEALPTHWQDQNQDTYMQFAKEGGIAPLGGSHCATGPQESHASHVAERRSGHEPQVGG